MDRQPRHKRDDPPCLIHLHAVSLQAKNIFLTADRRMAKLGDFGMSRVIQYALNSYSLCSNYGLPPMVMAPIARAWSGTDRPVVR